MNKAKVKKLLESECSQHGRVIFTTKTLEKLAELLSNDAEIVIEWNGSHLAPGVIISLGCEEILDIWQYPAKER